MFGKLREKFKNWTKKLSKDTEEKEEIIEEIIEEKPQGETQKQEIVEKIKVASQDKQETRSEKQIDRQLEKAKEEIENVTLPTKFDVVKQKYIPDLEKLEEIEKSLEKAKEKLEEKKAELEGKGYKEKPEEEVHCKKPFIKELDKTPKEKQGFFKKIADKVTKVKITDKEFEVYEEDLKMLLLENNVAYEVVDKIISRLKEEIVGKELLKKEIGSEVTDFFKEIIEEILVTPFSITDKIKEKGEKPYIILFCGINGTGKTTTIAKIANSLQKQNISCVLAAADTFRVASIEQINAHAEKLAIKVIAHDYGSDPAAVAFDAVKYAQKNKIDCVLIDTAGRMHSEKNLLKELEKISRVAKPDLKLFIGEAITGNDSIEQVRSFDWAIGIDGVILTKADTDEKGGTSLSVGYVTKKPILYLGTGQEYDKIIPFNKKKFIEELGL